MTLYLSIGNFLALFLLLSGCLQKPQDPETMEIRNAVRKYNRALIDAYGTFDMKLLEPSATEKEIRKVDVLTLTLREENKRLEARLEKLRFTSAGKITEAAARVTTEEKWRYRHVGLRDGKPLGAEKEESSTLRYFLIKTPAGWKVDSVEAQ